MINLKHKLYAGSNVSIAEKLYDNVWHEVWHHVKNNVRDVVETESLKMILLERREHFDRNAFK